MNRRDLEERVRVALGGTATRMAAELAVAAVLRGIEDGLREDGEVKLARFGTFRLKIRRPRRLTLPRSGQPHALPARTVLCFTPAPAHNAGVKYDGKAASVH